MSEHETELLGAYVLGVLDQRDQQTVRKHLDDCDACRNEVNDLHEVEAALGEIAPEAMIDGPPQDGDLLLQRTLREARGHRSRRDRTRLTAWSAAAAITAIAVLGGGTIIGRATSSTSPSEPTALSPAIQTPGPSAVVRTASATDARTGASMNVALEHAAGWVRVHATVTGVDAGQQCRLVVISRTGDRREAGSWIVSETAAAAGTAVDGAALVAPADVSSVVVETFAGQPLVAVPV